MSMFDIPVYRNSCGNGIVSLIYGNITRVEYCHCFVALTQFRSYCPQRKLICHALSALVEINVETDGVVSNSVLVTEKTAVTCL